MLFFSLPAPVVVADARDVAERWLAVRLWLKLWLLEAAEAVFVCPCTRRGSGKLCRGEGR